MTTNQHMSAIDELIDQASDAIARNDWQTARNLAQEALDKSGNNLEASRLLRTANAYLDSELSAPGNLSDSRELRFLSVMFCDVVGSTELANTLGDEIWLETLARFRRRCARAVRRYDGYVHDASGDELLVLFGYPRVREDDARRAVLAGLDIVSAIKAFSDLTKREHNVSFNVRVGVNTGEAIIGEMEIGDGLIGAVANTAKAIESTARPNTVWIGETTRKLVEGYFDYEDPKCDSAQPDSLQAQAVEVTGKTDAINRHQIATVRSDDIVGRLKERKELLDIWESARTKGAPLTVISGHAGIGKSRLAEYLAETIAGSGGSRLECVCTDLQGTTAFDPLISFIERFADIRPDDRPGVRLSKLDSAFRQLSPDFSRFIPYFAWMMSIPTPNIQLIAEQEPEAVRAQIFRALIESLAVVGSIRPSIFWIEDLHWADASTIEFCRKLAAEGPIPGVMVVATIRSGYPLPWDDQALDDGSVVVKNLDPLSPQESADFVTNRASNAFDDETIESIVKTANGNPLFMDEVIRSSKHQIEEGVEVKEQIEVPGSLQQMFAATLDRLGGDRLIAQIGALLGRYIQTSVIRATVARVSGYTESEVERGLTRLIDADVLEPLLTDTVPGYRFRHDLIRDTVFRSLLVDQRRSFHGAIGEELEASFPNYVNEDPDILAHHFTEAENYLKASGYRLSAGLKLQSKAAHEEALASFGFGLKALEKVEHIDEDPVASTHSLLDLNLNACSGVSVQTSAGYSDVKAQEHWQRAYEISNRIEHKEAIIPALLGLWSFYFVKGNHAKSINVANQMVSAAETSHDPEESLIGYECLGFSQYFQGDLVAGRKNAEHSWTYFDEAHKNPPKILVPQDTGIACINFLGPVRWSVGDQRGALEAASRSIELASDLESKQAVNLSRVGQFNAWLHQIRREPEAAYKESQDALAVSFEHNFQQAIVNLSIHSGLALAHMGKMDEGVPMVEEFLGYWRGAGADTMVPYFLGQLAEAFCKDGDSKRAIELIDEAVELGQRIGERFHEAELYRVKGEAILSGGNSDERSGIDNLLKSLDIARTQQAVPFEIRTLVTLADRKPTQFEPEDWIRQLSSPIKNLEASEQSADELSATALIEQFGK